MNPWLYDGRQLEVFNAPGMLNTQPGNSTRILFQDGIAVIVPEGHTIRKVRVASNNVVAVGTLTVQLVKWVDGGDEANPVAASGILTITVPSQVNADVKIYDLPITQAYNKLNKEAAVYSLRLIGTNALDRFEDPAISIGCEMASKLELV